MAGGPSSAGASHSRASRSARGLSGPGPPPVRRRWTWPSSRGRRGRCGFRRPGPADLAEGDAPGSRWPGLFRCAATGQFPRLDAWIGDRKVQACVRIVGNAKITEVIWTVRAVSSRTECAGPASSMSATLGTATHRGRQPWMRAMPRQVTGNAARDHAPRQGSLHLLRSGRSGPLRKPGYAPPPFLKFTMRLPWGYHWSAGCRAASALHRLLPCNHR